MQEEVTKLIRARPDNDGVCHQNTLLDNDKVSLVVLLHSQRVDSDQDFPMEQFLDSDRGALLVVTLLQPLTTDSDRAWLLVQHADVVRHLPWHPSLAPDTTDSDRD